MLNRLIAVFDNCFTKTHHTRLIKGGEEPVYRPMDDDFDYHRIIFSHDYFSSGLHEIAHWCIAGVERRAQVDYGYWYVTDGRNAQQQAVFESVEIKPQALEWLFSKACGVTFHISVDNLHGEPTDANGFKQLVYEQVLSYCRDGLPARAAIFHDALIVGFNPGYCLGIEHFSIAEL